MCLSIKQRTQSIQVFFKDVCREYRTWVVPWKNGHVYSGKNKSKDTEAEYTCTSERPSTKDAGLGNILESVNEDNGFYIGYIGWEMMLFDINL